MLCCNAERQKEGFTITEVLIAMAIIAMVITASFTIFRGASRSWTAGEERAERYQIARAILDYMSRDIMQAMSHLHTGGNGIFYGEGQRIFLTAPVGDDSDLIEIEYFLSSGGILVRRMGKELDMNSETFDIEEDISEEVEGLRYEYFDGTEWLDNWSSEGEESLPKAIRINIVISGEKFSTMAKVEVSE